MDYSEANRRRRGKRKKKNPFLNITVTVLVLLGLYFIAFHSGIFNIKKIETLGNTHYTDAQIAELSGVLSGDNIFKTRVSEVAKKLEKDPYIRKADVKWALPNGLDITVEERKESVLVQCDDGYAIVDYDGVILRMTQENLLMPVIVGLTPIEPEAGTALKAEEAGLLKPGLDFVKFIQGNDFYIKKLDLGGVVPKAYIFDMLIIEGDFDNIKNGIDELKRVIADLDSKGIERGTISVGSASCSFSPEVRN